MEIELENCTIMFPAHFDKRGEWEAKSKGWLQGVTVYYALDQMMYRVFFYDPVRLTQDLENAVAQGEPFVAEPGMIVIPEVTQEAIVNAIRKLCEKDYFKGIYSSCYFPQTDSFDDWRAGSVSDRRKSNSRR